MGTPKQITIRNPSPELARRLRKLSDARKESLNTTILRLLERAVGVDERRERLSRYQTWTEEDAAAWWREYRLLRDSDSADTSAPPAN